MDTQEAAPVTTGPTKKPNYRKPLQYDPHSEIIRGEHFEKVTGLSNTTVWRFRKAGKFVPIIQLGDNSIGARRADIEAWLASREAR